MVSSPFYFLGVPVHIVVAFAAAVVSSHQVARINITFLIITVNPLPPVWLTNPLLRPPEILLLEKRLPD